MQWEYRSYKHSTTGWMGGKIDEQEVDQALNRYGADGWELVSAFDTNMSHGETRFVIFVFKRPKP